MADPRIELRDLAAGFKRHLEARGRSGLVGVSMRPSPVVEVPVTAVETSPASDPESLTPYPTPPPVLYDEGKVLHAGPLGIYGNCIVVDHGYGLQTIYGHLSRIDVHEGDTVARGQVMGLSGMTGMAGGDHVHVAMQLDGVQIDPKEWWDAHWIQDHIARRVQLPGFSK